MEFKRFRELVQNHFNEMTKNNDNLFVIDLDKDELWNLYLDSFPAGTNEMFRKRREFDCSCCRQFIKNVGNVVAIKDNKVTTIWDFEIASDVFSPVVKSLQEFVSSKVVSDVFVSKFKNVGTESNLENIDGNIKKWEHLYARLPDKFVSTDRTIGDVQGHHRSTKDVFKRSLEEISVESVLTVLELISQNSLYRGEEWKTALTQFLKYKKAYMKLTNDIDKNNFSWENSLKAGEVVGKIKNHSIGTLLMNISENMDLDIAVGKFEFIVGDGYKRPKPIHTKKMLEDAQKTVVELGYMESLPRRFSNIEDITINNILFSNKDSAKKMGMNIFDEMKKTVPENIKKFSKIEEIGIEDFVANVLSNAQELEVLFENKHSKNLVSLISPQDKDSKSMFKWDNGFGWAYSGNIADSSMKENVKAAGGKVDGVLRFSLQWNDIEADRNDLDAHCIEPNKNEISFRRRNHEKTTGVLDTDVIDPLTGKAAVENITWSNIEKMEKGTYQFFVNCFSNRGGKSGFRAEIEFNGELYSFEYNKPMRGAENVQVAEVMFDGVNFEIKELLTSSTSSKEMWGLNSNQFVPVSVAMFSPNYWDEQKGNGNKHYMFMLKDCINSETPSGFFNEFLKQELVTHRKVFEALGSKMSVESTDNQLSGLGFSSTKRNELIVKVKGQTERVLKVKF